jgi:hypothetical protein
VVLVLLWVHDALEIEDHDVTELLERPLDVLSEGLELGVDLHANVAIFVGSRHDSLLSHGSVGGNSTCWDSGGFWLELASRRDTDLGSHGDWVRNNGVDILNLFELI